MTVENCSHSCELTCSDNHPMCLISPELGAELIMWLASSIHCLIKIATLAWIRLNHSEAVPGSGNLNIQELFPSGELSSKVFLSGSDILRFLHK